MNTYFSKPASKVIICNPPLDHNSAASVVQGVGGDGCTTAQDAARRVDKVEFDV
jgi:hypothetical protein